MCTALQRMPGLGEQNLDKMGDQRHPTSPEIGRAEPASIRSTLPSRPSTKEDWEIAQDLISHSRGSSAKEEHATPLFRETSAPMEDPAYPDRPRQLTPRSGARLGGASGESQDTTPNGQICRCVFSLCQLFYGFKLTQAQ